LLNIGAQTSDRKRGSEVSNSFVGMHTTQSPTFSERVCIYYLVFWLGRKG